MPAGSPERRLRVDGVDRPVAVVRAPRARKTITARARADGTIEVRVPARMAWRDAEEQAADLARRVVARRDAVACKPSELLDHAVELADQLELPRPSSVRYVAMSDQWGSCTNVTGEIRLSSRLRTFPTWVVDYVLAHELAHLLDDSHGPQFWALVNRYPLAERARGYLIAKTD